MSVARPLSGKKKRNVLEEEEKELARAERREANRIREERKAWRKVLALFLLRADADPIRKRRCYW